ncbi:aminotransferase class I/II-fold pyridoxal phosphate-dependent enzyme [Enterobacter cloacae subsp. cloacae]|nr:aminotransferase class I/II-fold pyridoxal phosphate-dependent enzyme [Enterobacter cloacae subsp. cloacae]
MFSANDLQQLVAVTRNTDIIILSDEVYEHVVLTVNRTTVWPHIRSCRSVASLSLPSGEKTYHVTGWRVGYCVAPAAF